MRSMKSPPPPLPDKPRSHHGKKGLTSVLESPLPQRKPIGEYKQFIQSHYDGLAGRLTGLTGIISGHEALAGQVFKPKAFDLRGCKRILDAACGNGRYSRFIVKQADADATLTAFDLSPGML